MLTSHIQRGTELVCNDVAISPDLAILYECIRSKTASISSVPCRFLVLPWQVCFKFFRDY